MSINNPTVHLGDSKTCFRVVLIIHPYLPFSPVPVTHFFFSCVTFVLKNASRKQGWIDSDSRRIDGKLLQSGDHTEGTEADGERFGGVVLETDRVGFGDDEKEWKRE